MTYSYSANFEALDQAIAAVIMANEDGQPMAADQHKAVSAIVTARRIKRPGMWGLQILSSEGMEIVDLPTNLYEDWKAKLSPPN